MAEQTEKNNEKKTFNRRARSAHQSQGRGEDRNQVKEILVSIMNRKVRRAIEILVILVALVGVSFPLVYGQEKPKEITPKPPAKAVWQMPSYMKENLQFMLDEFNRKWGDKLEFFKKELREKFSEFQSMPEDVLFDLQSGMFITRAEMTRLQAEAEKKNSEVVKKK